MQQIVNITSARNNLSRLVAQVAKTQQPVVIVRDSMPEAVLMSYDRVLTTSQKQDRLWNLRWDQLMRAGRRFGTQWAKKHGVNLKIMTEEKRYDLVKNAARGH